MSSFLITGATGYIGSMLIKKLAEFTDMHITALVRNKEKAVAMLPPSVMLLEADLTDDMAMRAIIGRYDYLVHCAAITESKTMIDHPVEVIDSIVRATQNVCELAKRTQIKSMVFLSSMEVYGAIECTDGHLCTEAEAGRGYIDICNVRSCYPLGKRMAENICYCYLKEYGLPIKIARLAQTFGKGVLRGDHRVFAQFADCVRKSENIILHMTGESVGNYCDIEDAIEGLLMILYHGENGEAYNIVNEACTMKIREMAELVADQIAGGAIHVRYEIPKENIYGYAADTGLRLSGEKLRALGWKPTKGLYEMYCELLK